MLVVGSSDEYGRVRPEDVPTNEDVPLRPTTPYAVSKVGQDVMGFQYFAQHGLPVVRVRPFNHTGPGHDARFVIPSFARQLAEIEAGDREPVLRVGNLDVARDFTDARDMVRAYRLALVAGVPGRRLQSRPRPIGAHRGHGRRADGDCAECRSQIAGRSGAAATHRTSPARRLTRASSPHSRAGSRASRGTPP